MKKVLVTGSGRGIGKAIATEFESNGYKVIGPSRTMLDLGSRESIQQWIETHESDIAVLINNAGENPIGEIAQMSWATWDRCLMVNLTAPTMLSQWAAQGMRKRRWGRIVNVGSIFSHVSRTGRAPYAAAKAGLLGLTRTAALEWGPDNVLVNAVCPGYIETDLTRQNNTSEQIRELAAGLPLRRMGQPDEIARLVFFLGSEQNTFMTGQAVIADGGFTVQ